MSEMGRAGSSLLGHTRHPHGSDPMVCHGSCRRTGVPRGQVVPVVSQARQALCAQCHPCVSEPWDWPNIHNRNKLKFKPEVPEVFSSLAELTGLVFHTPLPSLNKNRNHKNHYVLFSLAFYVLQLNDVLRIL